MSCEGSDPYHFQRSRITVGLVMAREEVIPRSLVSRSKTSGDGSSARRQWRRRGRRRRGCAEASSGCCCGGGCSGRHRFLPLFSDWSAVGVNREREREGGRKKKKRKEKKTRTHRHKPVDVTRNRTTHTRLHCGTGRPDIYIYFSLSLSLVHSPVRVFISAWNQHAPFLRPALDNPSHIPTKS